MLIVKGVVPAADGQLQLDNLVVNIEWPTPTTDLLHYWRTGDFKYALLEIGIHAPTGQLGSMTLVTVKDLWPPNEETLATSAVRVVEGIPVLAMGHEARVDEINDLRVGLGADRLSIEWGALSQPEYCIQAGRCTFGVDRHDALYSVEIKDLSQAEVSMIQTMFVR